MMDGCTIAETLAEIAAELERLRDYHQGADHAQRVSDYNQASTALLILRGIG